MDSDKMQIENGDRNLKRLGIVRMMAISAVIYASNLYEYAKQNSGPWKSSVGTIERAVTATVEPIYEKFKGVPGDLLVFLDGKVDEAANKFEAHAPPPAKWAMSKAQSMTQTASQMARNFVHRAQSGGPYAAIHYAGQIYKQMYVNLLATFWYSINQFTALHVAAQMAVPTVACWSDMYNRKITELAAKYYIVFGYFPHVPIEEITKAYKQIEAERGPVCTLCS